jgi:hypothetical protein
MWRKWRLNAVMNWRIAGAWKAGWTAVEIPAVWLAHHADEPAIQIADMSVTCHMQRAK